MLGETTAGTSLSGRNTDLILMSLEQSDKGDGRKGKKIKWFKLMEYVSEQL